MTDNIDIINTDLNFPNKSGRRRDLLPWWIKTFIWIFLVFAAIIPVGIIMGLLKFNFQISLLGLSTYQPISLTGLVLIILFAFKGIIALGLWQEKKWAVGVAKIDAIISALVCLGVMGYAIFGPGHSFSFRLELLVIFPYYYKMNQIQYEWVNFGEEEVIAPVTAE